MSVLLLNNTTHTDGDAFQSLTLHIFQYFFIVQHLVKTKRAVILYYCLHLCVLKQFPAGTGVAVLMLSFEENIFIRISFDSIYFLDL